MSEADLATAAPIAWLEARAHGAEFVEEILRDLINLIKFPTAEES